MEPKLMNCFKPVQVGTKEHGKMFETYPDPRRRQVSCQRGQKLEDSGVKEEEYLEGIPKIMK